MLAAIVVEPGQRGAVPRALARGEPTHVQRTAALGGQEELVTTVGEAAANVLFRLTVVHGNIDIVDAGIQYRLQDALGLARRERSADARDHAAQLQRAEAEGGHL